MLDRFAKMLEDAGHYQAAGAVCHKCRTPWPCDVARQTMGPELNGFGPEPGPEPDDA